MGKFPRAMDIKTKPGIPVLSASWREISSHGPWQEVSEEEIMNDVKEKTSQLIIPSSSHLPGLGNDAGQVEHDSSSSPTPLYAGAGSQSHQLEEKTQEVKETNSTCLQHTQFLRSAINPSWERSIILFDYHNVYM